MYGPKEYKCVFTADVKVNGIKRWSLRIIQGWSLPQSKKSDRVWTGLWFDLIIEQVMMGLLNFRGGLTRWRGFQENTIHEKIHTAHQCALLYWTRTLTNYQ